jgi:uncharacterized membrane protein (DUF2068 family)
VSAALLLMRSFSAIRAIAVLEATKGVLIFLVGIGVLSLVHQDVLRMADKLIGHLHLDPASPHPRVFIQIASQLTDTRLWVFGALAGAYGSVLLVEACGLWHGRRWAEWLAAISGSAYIPIEAYEMLHGAGWLSVGTLLLNIFIVASMLNALRRATSGEQARSIFLNGGE